MWQRFGGLKLGLAFWLVMNCVLYETATAQNPSTPSPAAETGWLDHWRLSTFSFGTVEQQNGRDFFRVIGTGVVMASDPQTGYFVTAKHVFDDPEKQWHPKQLRLRFTWQERQSVYDYLGTTLDLFDTSGKQLWAASEDGADIAAIPISLTDLGLKTGVEPHGVFTSDISPSQDMYEGATVVVLGYPGIVGNEYLVRSIIRSGIIAWLNPDDPYGKPLLIDANIYPGNSGGPVVRIPTGLTKQGGFNVGGRPTLLGIVSKAPGVEQDFSLQVPGAPLPLHLKLNIPLGGTGVIEPAQKIPAILKRLAGAR